MSERERGPSLRKKMAFYLGIDAGSVSLKLVVWDGRRIVWHSYGRISGRLLSSLSEALHRVRGELGDVSLSGVAVVGSGRHLIGKRLEILTSDEISAQVAAAREFCPEVRSIIEIGGQDAKAIALYPDGSVDFLMNDLCAAGTGAFLDQQAARLGMKIEELSAIASESKTPLEIASRCAVFAKSDMTHHQQSGRSLPDILAGLHLALAKGFIANVSRGLPLCSPICFHGGVAANSDLVSRFEQHLGQKISVPQYHKVTGALGAAIIGSRKKIETSFSALIGKIGECDLSDEKGLPPLRGLWSEVNVQWPETTGLFFGIDIGSVSVKFVALEKGRPVYSDYRYSNGNPRKTIMAILADARQHLKRSPDGAGVTGSGRAFGAWCVGGDVVPNEISAQGRACELICPDAEIIVEIGGQDAKFLRRKGGQLVEFKMNRSCAAGTGAFLTEQCPRLGFADEAELARHALKARSAPALGARCTVFMECELVACQQRGWNRTELAAALARSVIQNYLEKVAAPDISGKTILFLGGVAENRAVVAALSEEAGGRVRISKWGKYSAAIGAALLAADAFKEGRYSTTRFSWEIAQGIAEARCEGCENSCPVWKLPGKKTFGGRCGKHDQAVIRKSPDLLDARMTLLERAAETRGRGPTIGIPRALLYYDRLPLWREFFAQIGARIVVSPKGRSFEVPPMPADTCLPLKLLIAECRHLDGLKCDYLFVPATVTEVGRVHHCPFIQCAPLFASFGIKTPLLDPAFNWEADPKTEENALIGIGHLLGASKVEARRAYHQAALRQKEFMNKVSELGNSARSQRGGKAFVLLGKDYNIYDSRLNSGVAALLAAHLPVLAQDMVVSSRPYRDPEYQELRWHHGLEMVAAAKEIAKDPNLLPVMITSFGCGPDSFTLRYVREALNGKPLLLLEVDEHASEVGLATRIEAFLDSARKTEAGRGSKNSSLTRRKWKRVFIPNFSLHTLGVAAAVKAINLEPVVMPPSDEESYALAKKHLDGGECHPFALLLGDLLKATRSAKAGDCFFMTPSSTACRLGHFGRHMRMIVRDAGISFDVTDDLNVLAEQAGASPAKVYRQLLMKAWPVMRGCDLLYQRFFEVRRRAIDKKEADVAFEKAGGFIHDAVVNDGNVVEAFRRGSELLETVRKIDALGIKIGVTGDVFTRICTFANRGVLFDMSNMGAELLLPPSFTDVSAFDVHTVVPAALKHLDFRRAGVGLFLRTVLPRLNAELMATIPCDYPVPLCYERAREELASYIPIPMHNAVVGTLAAVMEQVHAGAHGIVNIITFNCTYGAIVAAFLRRLSRERGVPSINLIYEGLKPTHNLTRLEAFLNTVSEKVGASARRNVAGRLSTIGH